MDMQDCAKGCTQIEHIAELRETVAAQEMEHRSFKRRLDNVEDAVKKQSDILIILERQSNAIENMNGSVHRIENTLETVDKRVGELEREPGDKWKTITKEIIKYIVLAIVGVAVGYFINK
jgi:hypothetical protein